MGAALPKEVDSWQLDVLNIGEEARRAVVLYIFFDSEIGQATGRELVDLKTFLRFSAVVKDGYYDMPYHCYIHACDVLHTVYRILTLSRSKDWLTAIDQYALLVSALCHDIGHEGMTNPFLVETKHELATRYNDRSPLENMHCSRLFTVCEDKKTDAFAKLDNDARKQARKVCIEAILHTDNAHHFDMVKEISQVYEVTSEICDMQAREMLLLEKYSEQVLEKNRMRFLALFLHFADVSNPLKPFGVCKEWAWRVLDEFFAQGDEEKRLSLPVGMLNDRDKVNRPGSQHGFINFLVAPLVTNTVRLFAPLHQLSTQMALNLEEWRNIWVEEAQPTPEEIEKRDADVTKVKEIAAELAGRTIRRDSRTSQL